MLASCGTAEPQPSAQGTAPASTAPSSGESGPETFTGAARPVSTDLRAPWSVAFRNDTALISERDSGRILELADDGARG